MIHPLDKAVLRIKCPSAPGLPFNIRVLCHGCEAVSFQVPRSSSDINDM